MPSTRRSQAHPVDVLVTPAPRAKRVGIANTAAVAAPRPVDPPSPTSTQSTMVDMPLLSSPPSKKRKISSGKSSDKLASRTDETLKRIMAMFKGPDGRDVWDPTALNECLKNEPDFKPIPNISDLRGEQSSKPKGKLGQPSSSRTMVDSDSELSDLSDDEKMGKKKGARAGPVVPYKQTVLPLSMQNQDSAPLLVLHQRNWFQAHLVNFYAVTAEEHRAGKADIWEVQLHPAAGQKGPRKMKRKDVMYLDDDRVADCTLSKIQTLVKKFRCDAKTRAASPDADVGTLPSPADFCLLSRIPQLRHLRPHMLDLINERYAPAQKRIDDFHEARLRNRLHRPKEGFQYGDIADDEVSSVIMPELERWALRGCWPLREAGTEPSDHHIPQGSARYDELSPTDKQAFVFHILQPESIIYLCAASTESDDPLDSQAAYDAARERLDELAAGSEAKRWLAVSDKVHAARRSARKRLGMPEEHMSEHELRQMRLQEADREVNWFRPDGRVRKKQNYYEGEGKQRVEWRPHK